MVSGLHILVIFSIIILYEVVSLKDLIKKITASKKNFIIAVLVILLIVMLLIFFFGGNKSSSIGSGGLFKKDNFVIRDSETKNIVLEDYSNDLFNMKIPKGWKVDTLGDYIHYTIKVYDPSNPLYQFFLNLKTEGYNKSQDAKNWQQKYYPDSLFAKTSVLDNPTTEGFYKIFNDLGTLNNTSSFTFPVLNGFTVTSNLGANSLGGDILRATFTDNSGEAGEGIFMAYVYDVGSYYVSENIISGKQIDIYYLNVYDAIFMTTPKDEFINWESTLNSIFSSLQFTDTFLNGYNSEQDSVMKNFQSIRNIGNQISDSIMSSWENRSASYDIMSQKQSDATLGYERVYDTETNEVYKAYNGFTDDYDGARYKAIDDSMYTKGISGYIEKK